MKMIIEGEYILCAAIWFDDGKEYARVYPCCWGHTANCYGTRIGGYSESLDFWVR